MKFSTIPHFFGLSLVLFMVLWADATIAQNTESIGTVLVTRGQVQAVNADGQSRQLLRRSKIFVEDTMLPVLQVLLKSDWLIPQ